MIRLRLKILYHTVMIVGCEIYIRFIAFVSGMDKEQVDYLRKLGKQRAEWKAARNETRDRVNP